MTRLEQLKRRLKAREGILAYRDNVKAIQAEIDRREKTPTD